MCKLSLFLALFALHFNLFAQFSAGDKLIGGSLNGSFSQNPAPWILKDKRFNFNLNPTLHLWKNARWSNGFSLNLGINGYAQRSNDGLNSNWISNQGQTYSLGAGYQLRRWYSPLWEGKLLFYNYLGTNIDYDLAQSLQKDNTGYNFSDSKTYLNLDLNLGAGAFVRLNDRWGLDFQLQIANFSNRLEMGSTRREFSQRANLELDGLGWRMGIYYQIGNSKPKTQK